MKERVTLTAFSGLDQREVFSHDLSRSPDMRNFKVTENRTLKKREGVSVAFTAPGEITGLWSGYLQGKRYLLYTADGVLYYINEDISHPVAAGTVGQGRQTVFRFAGMVYLKNENGYYRFDGEKTEAVEGYIPLVAIGCAPSGGGRSFEPVNMLTSKRRVRFSCDGESATFVLPEQKLTAITDITYQGEVCPLGYTADLSAGKLTFEQPISKGLNNLEITYDTGRNRRDVILKAKGAMLFGGDTDGHLFLWGNEEYPAYRFHSELADGQPSAEYFPENNYTVIGSSPITDIISQYDRQLIFTKERAYYSYCQLRTDVEGHLYSSFPVFNLNGEKGSLLPFGGCIMNNEPVTVCEDGLNCWRSTTVENEKNAVCISAPVGKTLGRVLATGDLSLLRLYNHRAAGELYLICGEEALIYNYPLGVWYAYDGFAADLLTEYEGRLYFSKGAQLLFLDPDATADHCGEIHAHWETPYTPLRQDGRQKKLTEISFELCCAGEPTLDVLYGEHLQHGIVLKPRISEKDLVQCTFRTGAQRASRTKIYLQERDDAQTEIVSMTLVYGRKGRYERKGL